MTKKLTILTAILILFGFTSVIAAVNFGEEVQYPVTEILGSLRVHFNDPRPRCARSVWRCMRSRFGSSHRPDPPGTRSP